MTGEAHWLPLAFVLLATLLVACLWVADRRAERKYLVEHRNVLRRAKGNELV